MNRTNSNTVFSVWRAWLLAGVAIGLAMGANIEVSRADDGPPKVKSKPVKPESKAAAATPAAPADAQAKGDKAAADKAAGDKGAGGNGKAADKKDDSEQLFVRTLEGDQRKPVVLQTAIVTYRAFGGKYDGTEVDLIGAIHIADKSYYQELNRRFKRYDSLLYEMVGDAEMVKHIKANPSVKDRSPVSAMQSGMKNMLGLSFQLDEIDYEAKNFVHADMNPEEFSESLSQRQEGLMQIMMRSMGSSLALQSSRGGNDLEMLTALLSGNRELAMKRVLAKQIEQMDGQLAAISGDDGKSTLITERNQKALDVLKREMDAGKTRLGIFYGAGHFRHMSLELSRQFSMRAVNTQWLDAWDMH